MSFDPPRLHTSPTDAVLGTPMLQVQQPEPAGAFARGVPDRPLPVAQPAPLDGVVQGLLALTLEVHGLRADLDRRYQAVWFRRLWRWLVTRLSRGG